VRSLNFFIERFPGRNPPKKGFPLISRVEKIMNLHESVNSPHFSAGSSIGDTAETLAFTPIGGGFTAGGQFADIPLPFFFFDDDDEGDDDLEEDFDEIEDDFDDDFDDDDFDDDEDGYEEEDEDYDYDEDVDYDDDFDE
jgi:hypothetical protein